MDNHLNNQKMDGSEPQNLPFLLLSSKAIIKSDVYDSICVQAKLEHEFCLVPILPEFVVRSGGYLAGTG